MEWIGELERKEEGSDQERATGEERKLLHFTGSLFNQRRERERERERAGDE
jgi:hypothetical protein